MLNICLLTFVTNAQHHDNGGHGHKKKEHSGYVIPKIPVVPPHSKGYQGQPQMDWSLWDMPSLQMSDVPPTSNKHTKPKYAEAVIDDKEPELDKKVGKYLSLFSTLSHVSRLAVSNPPEHIVVEVPEIKQKKHEDVVYEIVHKGCPHNDCHNGGFHYEGGHDIGGNNNGGFHHEHATLNEQRHSGGNWVQGDNSTNSRPLTWERRNLAEHEGPYDMRTFPQLKGIFGASSEQWYLSPGKKRKQGIPLVPMPPRLAENMSQHATVIVTEPLMEHTWPGNNHHQFSQAFQDDNHFADHYQHNAHTQYY